MVRRATLRLTECLRDNVLELRYPLRDLLAYDDDQEEDPQVVNKVPETLEGRHVCDVILTLFTHNHN